MMIPQRIDAPELLDLGGLPPEQVQANLAELWQMNRWLGGFRALTAHLYPRLLAMHGTATLLDIGTGSGDIPAAVQRWAAHKGINLRMMALDLAAFHLRLARQKTVGGISLIQADATRLPFAPGSVDYVLSSLFFHHLSQEQVVATLRQAFGCARRGVIITDVTRGWTPLAGFVLLSPLLHPVTRHDGLVSLRRAYTPDEFLEMARVAGLKQAHVYRHPLWRMTLVADK